MERNTILQLAHYIWWLSIDCTLLSSMWAELMCLSFKQSLKKTPQKPIPHRWNTPSAQNSLSRSACALQWFHNERNGHSNHQHHNCLFNRLFRCRSKKTSKLRVAGPCDGNSPVTSEFPAQRASNAENVSIWWRHHGLQTAADKLQQPHTTFQSLLCW